LGFLFGLFFFAWIPKIMPFFEKIKIGWLFVVVGVVATQLAWKPLWYYYRPTYGYYLDEVKQAKEIAAAYKEGTILVHEGDPVMIYEIVRYGVPGKKIQGQMYDPFQYKPFIDYKDPFEKWEKDRKLIFNWLRKDNIKLIVFSKKRQRYIDLVKKEPQIFEYIKSVGEQEIYAVRL
jgi:hypothetical protein